MCIRDSFTTLLDRLVVMGAMTKGCSWSTPLDIVLGRVVALCFAGGLTLHLCVNIDKAQSPRFTFLLSSVCGGTASHESFGAAIGSRPTMLTAVTSGEHPISLNEMVPDVGLVTAVVGAVLSLSPTLRGPADLGQDLNLDPIPWGPVPSGQNRVRTGTVN